jgi:hypothetical protein
MMKIETVQKFVVNGVEYSDRAAAEHAAKAAPRAEAIKKAVEANILDVSQTVFGDSLVDYLAKNGDVLIGLLTIKQERAPRKAKTPAEQPAA